MKDGCQKETRKEGDGVRMMTAGPRERKSVEETGRCEEVERQVDPVKRWSDR